MNESEPKGAIALASVDTKAAVQHCHRSAVGHRPEQKSAGGMNHFTATSLRRQQNGRQRVGQIPGRKGNQFFLSAVHTI